MFELTIILRLLLAAVLGGAIGFLREIERKAAGLRTHTLVSLGSALLMLISLYMGEKYVGADAGRIAAGVITGIGFLGAGAIIREPGMVRGLTTAATIWVVAGVGLATGCGFYLAAVVTTLIAIITLQILGLLERKYIRKEE